MDPTDHRTVYTESQPATSGGNVVRTDLVTRQSQSIRPRKGVNIVNYDDYITPEIEKRQKDLNWGEAPPPPPPGQRGGGGGAAAVAGRWRRRRRGATMGAFRWNWSTPFILSESNPRTLYLGVEPPLQDARDRGDTWRIVSPDLTKNDHGADAAQVGRPDAGRRSRRRRRVLRHDRHGRRVAARRRARSGSAPTTATCRSRATTARRGRKSARTCRACRRRISTSAASSRRTTRAAPATCRSTAHETGNFKPYVFKTTDYGKTWTSISGNLPEMGPVYVVKEDLKNPNLLFAGTEFAVFYSRRRRQEVGRS